MRIDEKGFSIESGEVLVGSGLLRKKSEPVIDRVEYMVENMHENPAYTHARSKAGKDVDEELLEKYRNRYRWYRESWKKLPMSCIMDKQYGSKLRQEKIHPLCIDIEVSAVCDLACPFCFRDYYVTPDKLMDEKLVYDLIDQASVLGVPSIKFNWRGEPLLHPGLPEFIEYAKRKGILETIINTNATGLDEKKSRELISAGLDFMIYSFDGGSKETYEKMRPGRFKANSFDEVYGNIKRFKFIREEMGAVFPYTKIQMILTEDTFNEREQYYNLFSEYVDEVSVSQYSERGGELKDIDKNSRSLYEEAVKKYNLPSDVPYMKGPHGQMFVSRGRKACEQPFQRLPVTYEGRVAMCCYDWGAQHLIGYVDAKAFNNEVDYRIVIDKAGRGVRGYSYYKDLKMPEEYNKPEKVVRSLDDIWYGEEVDKVRHKHVIGEIDDVKVCRNCKFKDTYQWEEVE